MRLRKHLPSLEIMSDLIADAPGSCTVKSSSRVEVRRKWTAPRDVPTIVIAPSVVKHA